MKKAREGVQKELASPSHIIVQVVASIDELNKISNLMFERLNEWYGLHFPEFSHKDPVKYTKVARALDRTHPDKIKLEQMLPGSYTSLLQKAKNSVGVPFSDEDMSMLREYADALLNLYKLKDDLEKYEESLAQKLCPNITELAGAKVASQLVAHAGSLKKLAEMPSSTIQVIGAEKSLFKHLKTGSPPPKHGLIFQHPKISMAPKHARGKIARALAGKLAIAVKADAFSHNDIATKLKEQFDKRADDIIAKAKANPPKNKPSSGGFDGAKNFGSKRDDNRGKFGRSSGDSRPRRDGDRQRRFGSRNDYRRRDDDRPRRFNRDGDSRPRRDDDRPRRFGRDGDSRPPRRDGEKRFIRPDDDSPRYGKKKFGSKKGGKKFYHGTKKRSNRPRR